MSARLQRVATGFVSEPKHKAGHGPTLMAGVSNEVTVGRHQRLLEWRNKGYTVEAYNGFVHLMKVTDGVARRRRIVLRRARQGQRP